MKLTHKLAIAFSGVILVVFAVHLYLSLRWHYQLYEADVRRDHHAIGRTLRAAVERAWRDHGEAYALSVIEEANEREGQVRMRLVRVDGPASSPSAPDVDPRFLDRLRSGEKVVRLESGWGPGLIYTYVPLGVETSMLPALELTETLSAHRAYVSSRIVRNAMVAFIMVATCGVTALILGERLVGRRVQQLIAKAHRIGGGDFSQPLHLRGNDELARLAEAMNAMAQQLAAAGQRLEQEVATRLAAIEQLRHADRLSTVGRLASGIAHELGTPLNVVAERARMIETGETVEGSEIAETARIIRQQSIRMEAIVRQLLDFARRRVPQKEPTDLRELARGAVRLLSPLADQRKVALELDSASPPVRVRVDAAQLQQALANLLVNALDATPPARTVKVQVEVAADPRTNLGCARVAVVDEGRGIPSDCLTSIFDPFFTTKSAGEGTGLGLPIADGIVQEHGGRIDVHSEVGRGSSFVIWLPLAAEEG